MIIVTAVPKIVAEALQNADCQTGRLREQLVALQEELDWMLYRHFGLVAETPQADLTSGDVPQLARGHRPFEIALARRVAAGEDETAWFTRHDLMPTPEIPDRYDGAYRTVLEARLALIESDPTIALLEQPVNKRRWNFRPWDELVRDAARTWTLDALEAIVRESPHALTVDELLERLRADPRGTVVPMY